LTPLSSAEAQRGDSAEKVSAGVKVMDPSVYAPALISHSGNPITPPSNLCGGGSRFPEVKQYKEWSMQTRDSF